MSVKLIYKTLAWCFLFLLVSCGQEVLLNRSNVIENKTWNWKDEQAFEAKIEDTIALYSQHLLLRINNDYPFQNLYCLVASTLVGGEDTLIARYNLPLFDDRGKPLGVSKGSVWEYKIPIAKNVTFNKRGVYQFRVAQNMRIHDLSGVLDVGMCLEKTGEQF